jgi:hypothetical protein
MPFPSVARQNLGARGFGEGSSHCRSLDKAAQPLFE